MNSVVTTMSVQIPLLDAYFDSLWSFHTSYLKSASEILTLGFSFLKLIPIKNFKFDLKSL